MFHTVGRAIDAALGAVAGIVIPWRGFRCFTQEWELRVVAHVLTVEL